MRSEYMPKYLIKFIHKDFLQYFLERGLYMQAAAYYSLKGTTDSKQYDWAEGLASNTVRMYKNKNRPIWCCVGIEESEIQKNIIKLDKKMLKDFFYSSIDDGYLVAFDCKTFLQHMIAYKDEYAMDYGYVSYRPYQYYDEKMFTSDDWLDCLFTKHIDYKYQKEFRIAINRCCEEITEQSLRGHKSYEILKAYKAYEYLLPNLKSISKTYKAVDLLTDEKYIYFDLTKHIPTEGMNDGRN